MNTEINELLKLYHEVNKMQITIHYEKDCTTCASAYDEYNTFLI